mgnify:FL=1
MIIDCHSHIYESSTPKGSKKSGHFGTTASEFTAEDMIKTMDENNVDMTVANMLRPLLSEKDFMERNGYVADAAKKYPDRIIGLVRINPWMDHSVSLLEKAIKEMGLKGMKFHPNMEAFQVSDSIIHPLMEKASELDIPVQIHTGQWGCQPALVGELADTFPDVPIILAHFGGMYYKDAIFMASKFNNIYLETSAFGWTHRVVRGAIDKIGADRIIWGTDVPLHHIEVEMLKIKMAKLTEKELELALGLNAAKLFKIK